MIDELRGTRKYYSIDNLCAVFGYTRQAWYNYLKRSELQIYQEHIVLERIQEIRKELPKTGCIKLYKELNNGFLQSVGISMGRDAIFDLVRANGMLIKRKRKWVYPPTLFTGTKFIRIWCSEDQQRLCIPFAGNRCVFQKDRWLPFS